MGKMKIIGATLGCLVLALGVAYVGGRFYFCDHYYPNTMINGVDVSMKTEDEALTMVKDKLAEYVLTIHSETGDLKIDAAEAGLKYENPEEMSRILYDQDVDLWFEDIMEEHTYSAMSLVVDEEGLKQVVKALPCMDPAEPRKSESAQILYDKASQSYYVKDEIIGNHILEKKFQTAVYDAFMNLQDEIDLNTNEYYKQPQYFSTDKKVVKAKNKIDKYMQTVIHYEDAGLDLQLDGKKIHTFIDISKDFDVTFKNEEIVDYVRNDISKVFNTVGKKRKIKSPGSGTFEASGGTYGWQVGLAAERDAIIEDMKKGEEVTREPKYLQDAAKKDRKNDIGNSYVDVNIEKQELYVVKDGKIELQSSFVSGNVATNHDTDKGIFMIEFKRNDYEMRDYHVTVKYWMPFNTEFGEGFHDATWRDSFGGSIYKHNGSHGCVNLPYDVAKKMFEMLPIGYPVIVH